MSEDRPETQDLAFGFANDIIKDLKGSYRGSEKVGRQRIRMYQNCWGGLTHGHPSTFSGKVLGHLQNSQELKDMGYNITLKPQRRLGPRKKK